jgi:DNA-binding NarL/FixJ family response regulator
MPDPAPLRIIVLDDSEFFRALLVGLLDELDEVEVVAEGASGERAFALVREHRPDVAIIDLRMPVTGWVAMDGVRRARPRTRIVVLTAMDEEQRHEASRRGAHAVISKFGRDDLLAETVQALARVTGRSERDAAV